MSEHKQLSFSTGSETNDETVVCLGLTFNNDDERREYFREELRKKLSELKQIEGFPIGEDEDIIALSDPPYYTACPNPWINDFIDDWNELRREENAENGLEKKVERQPYSTDVSEGKNHPIYKAHTYHTKVPHRAIMKYLMHYTSPGDVILDAFSGTGMTAVAANYCGVENEVKSLGINDFEIGQRKAIISDLSPAASFISKNYLRFNDKESLFIELENLISKIEDKLSPLYKTKHSETLFGDINYVIWSEVYSCPTCTHEFNYWEASYDKEKDKVYKEFNCAECGTKLSKTTAEKLWEQTYDPGLKQIRRVAKLIPVQINYIYNGKRYNKNPDEWDVEQLNKCSSMISDTDIIIEPLPDGVNTRQPKVSNGIEYVHQFYTNRNLFLITEFLREINTLKDNSLKNLGLFILTASALNLSHLYRWRANGKGGILAGTLYVCSTPQENNPFSQLRRKVRDMKLALINIKGDSVISVGSATKLNIKNDSIDYIFTDPPFGANLMYSELNSLWEHFLKVKTNNEKEAIVNPVQKKGVSEYHNLMTESFKEYFRVLKPGKWITVEFSNSQSGIWNSIQEAIQKSGFIIATVSALDKKQGSFKAVTSSIAVKQDLVISAYKPYSENVHDILQQANSFESVWTFVSQHLERLPIFLEKNNLQSIIIERTPRILFDRMVAYYVQKGLNVPISSGDFQFEVTQKFSTRDGMVFLESQISDYDKKKLRVKELSQMTLFVSDETSAIEWLRQQLIVKPQSRQDLHTQFMKEIQHISKHEKLPELDDLLVQNFLRYDNEPEVPSQIVSYFRRNYPDLRGLEPTDEKLKQKAMNRWYVPDPNKQADLEKLREKSLLREFNLYVDEMTKSKKKLKEFRTEAIRAGFKKAWSEKDYQTIVDVGNRLPETVIQEDDKLLMYFDNAQIKLGL